MVRSGWAGVGSALLAVALTGVVAGTGSADTAHPASRSGHVLLVSVDGMHQSDFDWYVSRHPGSALARLVGSGTSYTAAHTPVPSDSFPGMVGQVTGGDPAATGIYYDDTYNQSVLPAGTTHCAGVRGGAEVDLTEDLDRDKQSMDAGQGLPGLPGSILGMTGNPATLINPSALPVDPASCRPIYPHQYLKVNTVFEVARSAGLRTAWSDKHPAYEILNGPSGTGVQDLFTPEINSAVPGKPAGSDWTTDNADTRRYDGAKVAAVLNEIDGYDHSRTRAVGTPAIFGLNFQTVSTAQKLPSSDGLAGGYRADGTPGPLVSGSLDFVDASLHRMLSELAARHLDRDTTVILSAKHGQAPIDPASLVRIDDGPILDALDAAWRAAHPGAGNLVAHSLDDDAMLLWLTDRSPAATAFASRFLQTYHGQGNTIHGTPVPFTASGLATVYAGATAARYFGVPAGDPRVPDVFGVSRPGVVYTGGQSKIAEHGGASAQDRDVPLVVSGAAADGHPRRITRSVGTIQIAPTILTLLGLAPQALQAVRIEHTHPLPAR